VVERLSGAVRRVFAIDETGDRIAQIWPPYSMTLVRRREEILVQTAVTDVEIRAARRFLDQNHEHGAARHGMLLCLYSVDDEERSLYGVAQIGEYYHTHFPGRAVFGRRIFGRGYSQLGRGEVIKGLPLAAAKRFAISSAQRGRNLGAVLARQTLIVARDYRWPSARVVEVSRHLSEKAYFNICAGQREDFLTRSGYVPAPPNRWLNHGRLDRTQRGKLTDDPIAGYYYADLSEDPRPRALERALAAWE
jgi:hypothetical protein